MVMSSKRAYRKLWNAGLRQGRALRTLKAKKVDVKNAKQAHDALMKEIIRLAGEVE
jgi:hypothetical protein